MATKIRKDQIRIDILCGALHAVNRYAAPAHTNTAAQTWSADSTVWGGGFHQ